MRDIFKRLYLATTGRDYERLARENGLGLELDQFCYSAYLDLDEKNDPLLASELSELGASGAEALAEAKRLSGEFPAPLFHGPFTELYPAAIDPKARALAMERMLQAYGIAELLGSPRMVFHSGYVPFVYFKSWHIERSVEFWAELAAEISKRREKSQLPPLYLLLENVLDDEPAMLRDTMALLERAGASSDYVKIGVCLDIGHANCASEVSIYEWLEALSPYLYHLHIHNNSGEHGKDPHLPPADGSLDVKEIILRTEALHAERIAKKEGGPLSYTLECAELSAGISWFKENFS